MKSIPSTKQPLSESFTSLLSRWINFHAFNAKCCAAGTVNVGTNFLILAVEQSLEAVTPEPVRLRFYSPAVAAWLAYAAPAVLEECRTNAPSHWRESSCKDRLWEGKDGFSVGRWEFWKSQLEVLRQKEGVDEDTALLMMQAFVSMEKAERAKKGKK